MIKQTFLNTLKDPFWNEGTKFQPAYNGIYYQGIRFSTNIHYNTRMQIYANDWPSSNIAAVLIHDTDEGNFLSHSGRFTTFFAF